MTSVAQSDDSLPRQPATASGRTHPHRCIGRRRTALQLVPHVAHLLHLPWARQGPGGSGKAPSPSHLGKLMASQQLPGTGRESYGAREAEAVCLSCRQCLGAPCCEHGPRTRDTQPTTNCQRCPSLRTHKPAERYLPHGSLAASLSCRIKPIASANAPYPPFELVDGPRRLPCTSGTPCR